MSDTLSKIEKRTAYILILPAVFLVFSIILFPIFANVWISFKEVGLKDIRIPEPRAKKIVKSIEENPDQAKIIYKLRNSSLILEIREVKFKDKLPKNIKPVNLDERCRFKSNKIYCEFGNWEAKYRENFEIILQSNDGEQINKKELKSIKPTPSPCEFFLNPLLIYNKKYNLWTPIELSNDKISSKKDIYFIEKK